MRYIQTNHKPRLITDTSSDSCLLLKEGQSTWKEKSNICMYLRLNDLFKPMVVIRQSPNLILILGGFYCFMTSFIVFHQYNQVEQFSRVIATAVIMDFPPLNIQDQTY